jgi:3-oxoacyl-[acyl-carrier protein] reductase
MSETNKTILITGSSTGIGRVTALAAKNLGWQVILHGKNQSSELTSLSQELECEFLTCDVIDEKAIESEVERVITKVGTIDCLVNNAGITEYKEFVDLTKEDWERTLHVNLLGTAFFAKAAGKRMLAEKQGSIVNIASIRGLVGRPGGIPYAASKAAVIALTTTLAKEFAPYIRVNAVAPGPIGTEKNLNRWREDIKKEFEGKILLNRLGKPEEVASTVLFLASEEASFITGQTLVVDGGYTISY